MTNETSAPTSTATRTVENDAPQYAFCAYPFREDLGNYVAELQLHMTLQARNLVPSFSQSDDSREQLLRESQELAEKLISRQVG